MAAHKKVDYESIAPEWRAGIKSPNQLAQEYTERTGIAVTRMAIVKHFQKAGVPRDLAAKIKAEADRQVNARMAAAKVAGKVSDTEVVLVVGSSMADIRSEHMQSATKTRKLVEDLISELNLQCDGVDGIKKMLEVMALSGSETLDIKSVEKALRKVISFSGRVGNAKALLEAFCRAVDVERKVYGIELMPPVEEEFTEVIIRRIQAPAPGTAYFPVDPDGKP